MNLIAFIVPFVIISVIATAITVLLLRAATTTTATRKFMLVILAQFFVRSGHVMICQKRTFVVCRVGCLLHGRSLVYRFGGLEHDERGSGNNKLLCQKL